MNTTVKTGCDGERCRSEHETEALPADWVEHDGCRFCPDCVKAIAGQFC